MDKARMNRAIGKFVEELMDCQTPERQGETWSAFEDKHLEEKFNEFITDLAMKYGRSRLSIKYKVARLLKDVQGIKV